MAPATNSNSRHCPVCSTALRAAGELYTAERLFEMWKPVRFSETTIREHQSQSLSTQLYRCPNCQLGIFLPQIIGTPAFYVEAYNLEGAQGQSSFTYSTAKWDFEEALKDVHSGERVLEVGAGPGHFLNLAAERGCKVVGVEFTDVAAAIARDRGFRVYDSLNSAAEKEGLFDCVFAFHVIEHVADPVSFLQALKMVTRPGGLIGIAVPNQDGPIQFIQPCIQDMPPHHATRWSKRTFICLAKKLSLTVDRTVAEPLRRDSVYYYSTHWVRAQLRGGSRLHDVLRHLLSRFVDRALSLYLSGLALFRRSESSVLPGQALYVAMTVGRPARGG